MEKSSNTSSKNGTQTKEKPNHPPMKSSQLMKLFYDELKDIYWAEKALTTAIPKMIENASSMELIEALTSHLEETNEHVARLTKVFMLINQKPEAKICKATQGLIAEAAEIMESCEEGPMRDAGIISAAQKVEHYEMATYGTLRQFAETLDLKEVVPLLAATLQEEKAADNKLSEVAIKTINVEAAAEAI